MKGPFTLGPSSCQTPLSQRWSLAIHLSALSPLSWEQCRHLSPCFQSTAACSAPSQSCASHMLFTAQQEPATGGTSKCQGWELLCLRANENISWWRWGSHVFLVFQRRLFIMLCSYKFLSCMASIQAHQGYLHTPTIFVRVLWRSKRQNHTQTMQ